MANMDLLRKKIDNSGISISHISRQMGISRETVYNKLNSGDFKVSEAVTLAHILKLSKKDIEQIFFTTNYEDKFGMKASMRSVIFSVEELGEDPIRLLGEYHLRAIQDPFFNKTMIEALEDYIDMKGIEWDEKYMKQKEV